MHIVYVFEAKTWFYILQNHINTYTKTEQKMDFKSKLIIVNLVPIWNNRYNNRVFPITLDMRRKAHFLIG